MSVKFRKVLIVLLTCTSLLLGIIALLSHLTSAGSARWEPAARMFEVRKVTTSMAEDVRVGADLSSTTPQHHCPYYPPDVRDIPFMFSRTTVAQFKEVTKNYAKSKPIALLVANKAGLPLLANWLCVSAQHLSVESVLVVIPPENDTQFQKTLLRKGLTAIQTSFRYVRIIRMYLYMYVRNIKLYSHFTTILYTLGVFLYK